MVKFLKNNEIIPGKELTEKELKVLNSEIRIQILKKLSQEPSYPAELSQEFNTSKQKMYYHTQKLEGADLIEIDKKEERSGGEAVYYKPTEKGFILDLGGKGKSYPLPEQNQQVSNFLQPLIKDSELNGLIVAGSPEQHGPDEVKALDGHLSSEIAFKLGNYSRKNQPVVELDTQIVDEKLFDRNMILLGGVLTNVIAKKFNENFPAYFPSEEFPYRQLKTPKNNYTESDIGVIAKTSNPENREKKILLVAGIREKGTKAAVKAFTDLENVVQDYSQGQYYAVIKGLDLNSDGKIDDYKVIETSEQ